jgi:hypothetical protein
MVADEMEHFSIVFQHAEFDDVVSAKKRLPRADDDECSTINVRGLPHAG